VGGDFYQVLPQPSGASLIVVGDVSGKGLKAAMTGATAIGAPRTLAAEGLSPGQILVRLNRQVAAAGQDGFITCLCGLLTPEGAFTFANAGHLNPYLMGAEWHAESGLPLSLVAAAEYPEATLRLSPGQQLTLLTDGVVEARSAGGELYGFDRTAAISTESAEKIAQAAKSFGQDDDSTVITVCRTAPNRVAVV
jgi:serine phosphatase RsbU (regulator of sigma subunit)